jgi:hypothetical protein
MKSHPTRVRVQPARAVEAAGLPLRCVAHGLRKAILRRLAERGGTAKELQTVSGHHSLKNRTLDRNGRAGTAQSSGHGEARRRTKGRHGLLTGGTNFYRPEIHLAKSIGEVGREFMAG